MVQFVASLKFKLIDCQVPTPHLIGLGAIEIPRKRFLSELETALKKRTLAGSWTDLFDQYQNKRPLPDADWPPRA